MKLVGGYMTRCVSYESMGMVWVGVVGVGYEEEAVWT